MRTVAIIPARMGSSRFPGKPLACIGGMPMVQHVYHRTALSRSLDDVFVATPDVEIQYAMEQVGVKVLMTSLSSDHPEGGQGGGGCPADADRPGREA
ncbi:MAG: cytidylyltransferase domain-containing protein [Candidatus Methylomirabilales bacterium]